MFGELLSTGRSLSSFSLNPRWPAWLVRIANFNQPQIGDASPALFCPALNPRNIYGCPC
jgi:hypothetical protein